MVQRVCTLSELNVDMQEVYLSMGYGEVMPEKLIREMIEAIYSEIDKICRPQYLFTIHQGEVLNNISINISGERFTTGKMITSFLKGAERFCVFTTSSGIEYDEYKKKLRKTSDPLKEFIADSIGSVVAEACVSKVSEELMLLKGDEEFTFPYSPGYCGWKLTEQRKLLSLMPDKPCGITLTDSCLMMPIKSVSGIMAMGKNVLRREYGCSICDNIKNCYKRKI